MSVKTLLNSETTIVFHNNAIEGPFSQASIGKLTYNSESWVMVMGADGRATRVQVPDGSARLDVFLQQTSPANKVLTSLYYADKITGVPGNLFFDNPRSGVKYSADTAWVVKIADDGSEAGVVERVWTIETDNMKAIPL